MRLDDGDYRVALDTGRSRVATAGQILASIEAQIGAAREAAEAQLRIATTGAERAQGLAGQGVTPQAQLDEANEALDTAAVASAEAQVDVLEANYKETQMASIVPGEKVHVTFDASPDQEFEDIVASTATGAVFSLLPADNATGNFTKVVQRVSVRIELPEEALATGQLRAGLSRRRGGGPPHRPRRRAPAAGRADFRDRHGMIPCPSSPSCSLS